MPMRLPIQSVRMGRHSYRGDVVTYDPRAPSDAEPRLVEMAFAPKKRAAAPKITTAVSKTKRRK